MKIFSYVLLSFVAVLMSTTLVHAQQNPKNQKIAQALQPKIEAAIDELVTLKTGSKKKVLVFSMTKGYRHRSIPVGQLTLKLLGEKTGAFDAVISNELNELEADAINQYDAIVFLNTTGELFSPHTNKKKKVSLTSEEEQQWKDKEARLKANLMAFIKGGKGFVGLHSATDTFYKWPEYGEMIGAYFDGHPWTAKIQVNIKVADQAKSNPLVSYLGSENLIFKEEIYQYKKPIIKGNATVLLQLDPQKNDFTKSNQAEQKFIPISWVKSHGKGKVFYSSLGHNNEIYHNPKVLQHFLNGIQWATN